MADVFTDDRVSDGLWQHLPIGAASRRRTLSSARCASFTYVAKPVHRADLMTLTTNECPDVLVIRKHSRSFAFQRRQRGVGTLVQQVPDDCHVTPLASPVQRCPAFRPYGNLLERSIWKALYTGIDKGYYWLVL